VRSTAAHLAGRQFTAAYVGPCGRAQATAHEILAHHPSALAVTDPDLREFCCADLKTRPEAELLDRYHPDSMFAEVLDGTFAGIPVASLGATSWRGHGRHFPHPEQAMARVTFSP